MHYFGFIGLCDQTGRRLTLEVLASSLERASSDDLGVIPVAQSWPLVGLARKFGESGKGRLGVALSEG